MPVAVGHCGVWNHTNELMMWCRPNGMSRRLAMPYANAPIGPLSYIHDAMLSRASPMGGQAKPKMIAHTMPATAVSIGTRRRPLKNANAAGSFVRW